ncbi:tRNA threonylcarbamoyladenosine biosynthesis protein TsaB [Natronobacillus azotifigens]|uniref:tRNA (Adenosine(37)-N6)-threonylcarbamoyltransferase complex dimerization subunit type 1 TsaB n=1 Tax=Natronobacillus azotifigens TaxID=472978 RepID=A0A9J6RF53_9BACI|nr:tRNA (adenosine(37)-N6)-threonylcarbamoyltransferase complex dimerization subunit type 1 TsaB [Natronobacillus azotifigens]MCZ0704191.1 tRNA (adenosine(37)-N6)-threonylcarbamoyltransferase complex dimerization subunit type 1 TsaB [Natronobacillus azotifigens]
MNILAIDTSNDAMGIAIYQQDKVIAEYVSINKNKHSTRLMPAIAQVMEDANVTPRDLTKIVVAKGPGSYTGVRIGLSVAKTMAWSLQIPVVAVSSLEILALQAKAMQQLICPFFDARRGLVFTGLYQFNSGEFTTVREDQNILFENWLEQVKSLNQAIIFISPDLSIYQDLIQEKLGELAIFLPEGFHNARPSLLAIAGKDRTGEELHSLQPSYLRLVEAEAKWLEEQKEKQHE